MASITTPFAHPLIGSEEVDRYEAVRQYSLAQILAVWVAATAPMGILAWVVAPWLSHHLGGRDPLIESLLICFNAGLIWLLALVLILVRREQGDLAWPHVRDALWLRSPRDPKTHRVGGRVWWWVLPFTVLAAAFELAPINPAGPLPRDLPKAIDTDRVEHFFSGNWGWFAVAVLVLFLPPVVEELLFRGLLQPRMRAAFGKGDWVASGTFFTLYHVHQPWSMPATLLDGIFAGPIPRSGSKASGSASSHIRFPASSCSVSSSASCSSSPVHELDGQREAEPL